MDLSLKNIGCSAALGMAGAFHYVLAFTLDRGFDKVVSNGTTINVIRTGCVLLALSVLVGSVAKKKFDDTERSFELYLIFPQMFIPFTACTISPPVTFMMGLSPSLDTAFMTNVIVSSLITGTYLSVYAIGNILLRSDRTALSHEVSSFSRG